MSVNYGSKRVVVGAHYGLRDWLAQRITACIMAIFTVLLLAQVRTRTPFLPGAQAAGISPPSEPSFDRATKPG